MAEPLDAIVLAVRPLLRSDTLSHWPGLGRCLSRNSTPLWQCDPNRCTLGRFLPVQTA